MWELTLADTLLMLIMNQAITLCITCIGWDSSQSWELHTNFYPWLTDKNLRHTDFEKRAKFTQLLRLKPNSILLSLSHYTFLSLHGKWPVTCGLGRQLKTGWWKKDERTGEWMDRYVPWLKYLYQSKGQSLTFFF